MATIGLACLLPLLALQTSSAQDETGRLNGWRSFGPQEAIWALALDPVNPNNIFGGGKSGVFKSTDCGVVWKTTGLKSAVALAIDYANPNTIYAGTVPSGLVVAPGKPSAWKSTDGGDAWSNIGVVDYDGSLLVLDPTSPTTLYAGSLFRFQEEGGIILRKTTDGGQSWVDLRARADGLGSLGLSTYGWAFNRAEPQSIYVAGNVFLPASELGFYSGLFKSTDGGKSWNGTGLTVALPLAVVLDPSNPKTLYAGTVNRVDNPTFAGMFKSTDAGESWLAINNGLSQLFNTFSRNLSLVLDPLDPNTLYAGTSGHGVFRSTDGGAVWSQFNPGLTNLNINALAIDTTGRRVFVATDLGVFDYQFAATPCAAPLSVDRQSFEYAGGTGSVNVTASDECRWTAVSYADWIAVTPGDSKDGSGTISYSVPPNRSASPRAGTIEIGERFFTVTQTGAPFRISNITVAGKKLFVTGEGFAPDAVILLNGTEHITKNDDQNPDTTLIGKKAGKKIKAGDRVRVRNPDGSLSEEFTFTGLEL